MRLEFNSPSLTLHKNETENGLTFFGIYECAHPDFKGWELVKQVLKGKTLKEASVILYNNSDLVALVYEFYKREFWDKMRLDEVESDLKASEVFIFGVNVDTKPAVRVLQRLLNVTVDGFMGAQTLKALNAYDEDKFNVEFDSYEIAYYASLVSKNPKLKFYANGWKNRALAI
ncbi:putative peptidoglycan-binding domain-containing protein [Campylobacter concisus]|uniref:putative peptidoglycan-binding domain-containing protein n=1 Tax=Campylobacter concisus TaxID=199 RepID=UPI000CD86B9A|nr:putative peptidoglycan-binding domain-containing protein [Campylobacter concisus]